MIFKHFRIQIKIRILLISVSIFLFFLILFTTELLATTIIVGLAAGYQVYALIKFAEKTNHDLSRFLLAIRHGDYSQYFSRGSLGRSFEELNTAFNEVIEHIQEQRSEKEEHYWYLQAVVQHIGIGLIAYQPDGNVDIINNAAKRLLNIKSLKNVNELSPLSKELVNKLLQSNSKNKTLVQVNDGDDLLQLAIHKTDYKLRGKAFILASLQNIQSELEEKEMEAWQKLIRVLTHEIMNSITPIASLASTANDLLSDRSDHRQREQLISGEVKDDIRGALHTIHKRSEGLLTFVNAYRNLTRIPKPKFQIFPIKDLFSRLENLLRVRMTEQNISFQTTVEPNSLELTADPELIEQILINLIVNSIEALEGRADPKIELHAFLDKRGKIVVQVSDNGPGIIKEAIEKIFIPFFTTKKNGSGIGLSLSRQIMRLHGGSIHVSSEPDVETVFTLRF